HLLAVFWKACRYTF
ncbi:RNA polymerase Rpb1, domain 1 family protein, partial [Chlamydia psittaci C6/98]